MCRDILCIIFKVIENNNIEIIAKVPITKDQEQQIVISFVDDTNLLTNGINSERKI